MPMRYGIYGVCLVITLNLYGQQGVIDQMAALYKAGRLDSAEVEVLGFPSRRQWMYMAWDTVTSSCDNGYTVGYRILDPFMEFQGLWYGEITEYTSAGFVTSSGEMGIGYCRECASSGPYIHAYNVKTGWWYNYDEGIIRSRRHYALCQQELTTNCSGHTRYLQSQLSRQWAYDDQGVPVLPFQNPSDNPAGVLYPCFR